jgi:hypothetical protein
MDRETFFDIGNEVFDEYLPKTKKGDREEFLASLLSELADRGIVDVEETSDGGPEDPLFDDAF